MGPEPREEQIASYRRRASRYDDWWFRRGGFDLGPGFLAAWRREIGVLERALETFAPGGDVLELAAGTVTRRLEDGDAFTLVRRYRSAGEIAALLAGLGWEATVTHTAWAFLHGHGTPPGRSGGEEGP